MNWTETLYSAHIWLSATGTAELNVRLERVGPLFRVGYELGNPHPQTPMMYRWYFKYSSAKYEYDRQCLLAQEYAYGD